MQGFQIAAIIIGIITTILVGVKSGAKNPRLLDVLAIISAAIGTGVKACDLTPDNTKTVFDWYKQLSSWGASWLAETSGCGN
jgi:hypothetical protein